MDTDTVTYETIFEGDLEEAKKKFPFITKGIHVKAVQSWAKNIGVFPNEHSFYVVTMIPLADSKSHICIEETNRINILTVIVNRETGENPFLSDEQLTKIKEFLQETHCHFILE